MSQHASTREREGLRAVAFDDLPAGVAILDSAGMVVTVNQTWRVDESGNPLCDQALLVGSDYPATCRAAGAAGVATAEEIADGLLALLAGSRERLTHIYSFDSGLGQRWCRITARRLSGPGAPGALVMHSDVTERMLTERRILSDAQFDPLTGLPNHSLFRDRLEYACAAARRDRSHVAVLYVDADGFSRINDRLGRAFGDRLIAALGARLRHEVRESDTIARLAADRFAIVLTHLAEGPNAARCASRLLRALQDPFQIDGHEIRLAASIGVSLYPEDTPNVDALVRLAEETLHRAKLAGGNDFRFFTPETDARLHRTLESEEDLRGALERGEFVLHYQPKLSCATGKIIGAEALLRWLHPQRGLVSPAEFVPILEQSGMIAAVGAWVTRAACAQARQWHDAGFPDMCVAVNLTGRQLREPALLEQVRAALDASGLPPHALELDLTESLLMEHAVEAAETMRALRELGVRLSIDDFGTGYSSLSHLKRLPVNSLKIDRSFIHDIVDDPNDVSITRAIIQLAHQLRLKVVAVGVETESQLGLLIGNGCDEIQGHFFSRACPVDEITVMLRERRGLPSDMLPGARGGRTLLLVDDEENIVAALRRLLRRSGYRILTADSASMGLEVLAREKVDVIISDQRMPGMSGVDFLRRVKVIHPDTVRIVLSGYTELQSITDAINEGAIYKFLTKPWDEALLLANIDEAFKHRDMIEDNRRLGAKLLESNSELARVSVQLEAALGAQREHIARSQATSGAREQPDCAPPAGTFGYSGADSSLPR